MLVRAMARWLGVAFVLSLVAAISHADESLDAGTALARQVYARPDGRDLSLRLRMTLTERGHAPRNRLFYSYRQDLGGGNVRSLARFQEPADVAGTGLLTLDTPAAESAQWLYLPAIKKERRISGSRKGGRFVGSDLYFEDLRDRPVERDRHRLIGTDSFQGTSCQVLESIPSDPDNSVYSKRLSCIHPETFLPLRIEFFAGGKTVPAKRFTVSRIKRIQGYWTVLDSTMTDLSSGHETRIEAEAVKYDQGLPASLFSVQTLTDPAQDKRFRP
ncbi:outer membrane lipoprotein-sorting protein [Thiocystis violascens]|uniref:Uncharacterized protein TP-0789 domain-containing protein n=1 Tax=Thiocystis violascens (strain ATCC 17096 / DSM 198 / 6111) TaxID=765911 RepID=I3YGG4_THIV6|nr:outer membrane lipoprotein-sorting protein [Thiocystis violascens]AFL76082.1 hypothetical protein Thivi_4269 [Thiocystis violascens DSM 198]